MRGQRAPISSSLSRGNRATVTKCLLVVLILVAAGLPHTGCSESRPNPPPTSAIDEQPAGGEQDYTACPGNGVDVFYFEERNPCECMAECGVVIKNAIRTRFGDEVLDGSLRFFVIVSDDWSNGEALESFNNPLTSSSWSSRKWKVLLLLREIWSMMGDDDTLEFCVETRVRDALSTQRSS